jgi:hypothetical protein
MKQLTGHLQRVRYTIESNEKNFAPVYKITGLTRCGKLFGVRMERKASTANFHADVVVLGLAVMFENKIKKHLNGCKTCRIAKKKMKDRLK